MKALYGCTVKAAHLMLLAPPLLLAPSPPLLRCDAAHRTASGGRRRPGLLAAVQYTAVLASTRSPMAADYSQRQAQFGLADLDAVAAAAAQPATIFLDVRALPQRNCLLATLLALLAAAVAAAARPLRPSASCA
jgi:hypothetical protein